jgi:gliding motility-associated-like protein
VDDAATVSVQVSSAADAGSSASVVLCTNAAPADLLTLLGGTPAANGSWTAPDGSPFTGPLDPAAAMPGAYTYTVVPQAPCTPATATVMVGLEVAPAAAIEATNTTGCSPLPVTLTNAAGGSGDCVWTLGDGQVLTGCGPITAFFQTPGVWPVTLTVTSANGCGTATASAPGLVQVTAVPTAGFTSAPDRLSTAHPTVHFANQSVGASAYAWWIDGAWVSSETSLTYTFTSPLGGSYEVCLVALAAAGCADTLCTTVTVEDGPGLFVPNAFSPDGDGINDLFVPVAIGMAPEGYVFEVHDRWGRLLFSAGEPGVPWDGKAAGEEVPTGVYVWRITARDALSARQLERTGHVTVLR